MTYVYISNPLTAFTHLAQSSTGSPFHHTNHRHRTTRYSVGYSSHPWQCIGRREDTQLTGKGRMIHGYRDMAVHHKNTSTNITTHVYTNMKIRWIAHRLQCIYNNKQTCTANHTNYCHTVRQVGFRRVCFRNHILATFLARSERLKILCYNYYYKYTLYNI